MCTIPFCLSFFILVFIFPPLLGQILDYFCPIRLQSSSDIKSTNMKKSSTTLSFATTKNPFRGEQGLDLRQGLCPPKSRFLLKTFLGLIALASIPSLELYTRTALPSNSIPTNVEIKRPLLVSLPTIAILLIHQVETSKFREIPASHWEH